ncbi:MAG: sensor histidine kinase [Candidatus Eiseniibacteriota bacterium]
MTAELRSAGAGRLAALDAGLRAVAMLPIRTRLLVAFPSLALLVLALGTLLHLFSLADREIGQMVRNSVQIAQQVSTQIIATTEGKPVRAWEGAVREDRSLESIFTSAVGYYPYITYIAVANAKGEPLAHSSPPLLEESVGHAPDAERLQKLNPVVKLSDLLRNRGRDYEVVRVVGRGGQPFATIHVGMPANAVLDALWPPLRTSLLVAGIAFVLALIVGIVLADLISKPLRKLAAGIEAVGQGDFGQKLEINETGEVAQLFSSFNVMAERLAQDRTAIEERGRRLAALVDGLEDGVVMVDVDGRIALANPTACRVLGRTATTLAEQRLDAELGAYHPLTELWRGTRDQARAQERAEVRFDSDARGDRYLLLGYPVGAGPGQHGVVLTLRNSDSLRKLTTLLDESQRMIAWGQVALGVAHEIKNPLQAMFLNLELAREKMTRGAGNGDVSGPMRNLNVVGDQIRRLDEVVNGFLRIARMTQAEREPLNVNAVLSEVVSLLSSEAEERGVGIRFSPQPGLPTLWGDRGLLYQAFLNLTQNAIEAGPHAGPIEIDVVETANRGLAVRVRDRGRGISRHEQARVFDLFFTTRERGSGIGLAIVQRVAQLHGGNVTVDSEAGKGTTFTVWLPLNVPLATAPEVPAEGAA